MMNVLNGGAHADNSVDFQEFMIVPVGARSPSPRRMRIGTEVYHELKATLHARGLVDGASATRAASRPNLESNEAALELLVEAIEAAGYRAGRGRRDRARPGRRSEFYSDGATTCSTAERPHAAARRS